MRAHRTDEKNFDPNDHEHVAYSTISRLNMDGKATRRLLLVLRTPKCTYGKCVMCGFDTHADMKVDDACIRRQYRNAIAGIDFRNIGRIDLLTAGSFFNNAELSRASRDYLFTEARKLPVQAVLVETRAEYVTTKELKHARSCLRKDQRIEVGIGLETGHETLRNKVICKGLLNKDFERFVSICARCDCDVLVYVLIKPPTLSEREGIEEAVRSAEYAYAVADRLGVKLRVAFKPMFIARNSSLERQYLAKRYKLPTLWSAIETVRRTALLPQYQKNSIFVGMFDEDLSDHRFSHNCSLCNGRVVEALKEFNGNQDIFRLVRLRCRCKSGWQRRIGTSPAKG